MGVMPHQSVTHGGQCLDFLPVLAQFQRCPDPVVIPGFEVASEPEHLDFRGFHGRDRKIRVVFKGIVKTDRSQTVAQENVVHLAGFHCGDQRGGILADIMKFDAVQVGQWIAVRPFLPVIRPGFEHGPFKFIVGVQGIGTGAIR